MLIDFRAGTGLAPNVDLCIIGAGAAGLTIAQLFLGSSKSVCIVESGGRAYEPATEALYAGRSIGQPVDLIDGRVRALGGSTNHWGGRCGEFSEAELVERDWIPKSGWPLQLKDLAPYYGRAWELCGLDASGVRVDDVLRELGASSRQFSANAKMQVWQFVPSDGGLFWNFGTAYADDIARAPNVTLALHANLTDIHLSDDGSHVDGVTISSPNGHSTRVVARAYALCCSGIENARLMLAGGPPRAGGVGNARGLVGRYFMEHSRAAAATVYTTQRLSPIEDLLTEYTDARGARYQTGLVISERAQREHGLLNASAVFEYAGDPRAGVTAAQDIWRNWRDGRWPGDSGDDVWNIIRDFESIAGNADRYVHGRPPVLPLDSASVVVDIEQLPDRDSRITLGSERDALGIPIAVVDWRVSDLERRTARQFMIDVGLELGRRNIGRLRLEPWLAGGGSWREALGETYHYIGTTRMSSDPAQGVVDVDSRVHDVDNLFVGGSSVFPTGGHVNPTLTIVALAVRLADHLHYVLA
jgi:choline dehydrogenase-like flavoprotein